MTLAVQVESATDDSPRVAFRWDPDTDILSVAVADVAAGECASVELAGADGSWLILDVAGGRLAGLEVAIWPDVVRRDGLVPPSALTDGRLVVRGQPGGAGARVADAEIEVTAESDAAEEVIYFRVGAQRSVRTIRIARDLLVDVDRRERLAGFWLLNVPPFPSTTQAP